MTQPYEEPFDLSTVEPQATEWGVPQPSGQDAEKPREPRPSMREQLAKLREGKQSSARKPRNVKLPKEKKDVPNIPGQFVQPLTDMYNMLGVAVMPFEPELTMTLFGPCRAPQEDEEPEKVPSVAENCARSLDEAAQRSESVRRALSTLTTASVWGGVIMAHAPIAAVLLKNHGPWKSKDGRLGPAEEMEQMLRRQSGQAEQGT